MTLHDRLRSTRLFHQIFHRILAPDVPFAAPAPAQAIADLFASDPGWKPGNGAVIWNTDDQAELKDRGAFITPEDLSRQCRNNPDALLDMLHHPALRGLVIASAARHLGDIQILSSVAEAALSRHGDEAARTILSSPELREAPSMRYLGWDPSKTKAPPPREGCLAFQALDYTGDLSLVLEYPDLWDLRANEDAGVSESWLERAAMLARSRNDRALFQIRACLDGHPVPLPRPAPARPVPLSSRRASRLDL